MGPTSPTPTSHPLDAGRVVTLGAGLIGGALLLVSIFLPWSRTGAGSAISARDLGDLALSGTIEAWASRWLGAAIYVVPASGALILIGSGLGTRIGLAINLVAVTAAALVLGTTVVALGNRADHGIGPGAILGLLGLLLSVIATVAGTGGGARLRAHRTSDQHRPTTT